MAAKSKPAKPQPAPLADIFVSYSFPDLKTAKFFAKWIGECGLNAHLIEPGEGGGKSFAAAMNEAIEGCERLLAVFTRHYDDSKACTAEIEGMWRRDQDGRLGRILIVRLDDTKVPALYAVRDNWDFTKIPGDEVMDEFFRRIRALEPIRAGKDKTRKMPSANARKVLPIEPAAKSHGGMSASISGNNNDLKQVVGQYHEHHHHGPAKFKNVLERRGDEISNAQAAELLKKLKDWGRALWESMAAKKRQGKMEGQMHAKVQGWFKAHMRIPRYDALEAALFPTAMDYITVEIAMLRPKLMRADPIKGKNSYMGSIKQAMKEMGETNETYYPKVAVRLKMKPFLSLTQLPPKDLKRVYNMARGDVRK